MMGVVSDKSKKKTSLMMVGRKLYAPINPPVNTNPPVITGDEYQGETLTCSTGGWMGRVDQYDFQWYRGASGDTTTPIGTNQNTYVLQALDVGETVWCRVTATNAAGSNSADSAATGVISGPLVIPTRNTVLNITGTAETGETLTVTNPDDWGGNPAPVVTGQWRRDGVAIPGETSTTYVTQIADIGSFIDYQEAADNSYHPVQFDDSNDIGPISDATVFRTIDDGSRRTIDDASERTIA